MTWDRLHNKSSFPSYNPPNDRHGSPLQSFVMADDGDSTSWSYQEKPGNRIGDTQDDKQRRRGPAGAGGSAGRTMKDE